MTRSFDEVFGDWLEDGPTQAPDRVLESLRTDVARTTQRRPFFLRLGGFSAMDPIFKVGAVATGGIAVFVLALSMLGGSFAGIGGPPPTPDPTSVPTATPSVTAPPSTTSYESDYLPWAIELPAGWVATTAEGDAAGSYEQFAKFRPTLVNAGVGSTEVPSGTSPEDYVQEALDNELELMQSECGIDAFEPADTTMGGEPAFELLYECNGRGIALIVTSHNNRRYVFLFEAADVQPVREAIDELLPAFEFTD